MEEANISDGNFSFSEESVRKAFIKKVYGILTVQLLITFGIVAIIVFVQAIQQAIAKNPIIFWIPLILSLVFIIILSCAGDIRRRTPYNFIFLLLFTICEGVTIGCIAALYDVWEVSIAVVATMAVCIGLTIFAFQTKIDFTMMSGVLLSLLMVLMTFGIFAIIFPGKVMTLLYACMGALVFSIYLVFDTQMILGGKHKIACSPEEYIFAALNLYLDVIKLFMFLLIIIGIVRD